MTRGDECDNGVLECGVLYSFLQNVTVVTVSVREIIYFFSNQREKKMSYSLKSLYLCSALVLSACATNPLSVAKFDHSFPDRVLEINEAYYAELNGQILKNILRARDRHPRMYTSLSDLKITPSATRTNSVNASEFGLGNPGNGGALNPWITFGGSSMMGNGSTLELTISPKATNGDNNTPIYHDPISAQTFLTYYNDWSVETVDNVLVDQIRRVVDHAELATKIVLDSINSDGAFKVFVKEGVAEYCLNDSQCPLESGSEKPANVVTSSEVTFNNSNPNAPEPSSHETTTTVNAATASKKYSFKNTTQASISLDRILPPNQTQLRFNFRQGKLFACVINTETFEVKTKTNPEKGWTLYECTLASQAASIADNATLIYVANKMQVDAKTFPQTQGIYAITPSSIDNMVFRIGASLKQDESKNWTSTINDETNETFFSIKRVDSLTDTELECLRSYAARTIHQGKTYLAGPPEASDNTGNGGCYKNDNSGTVLTLISEIIKLNEVNAELKGSSFILPR